MGGLVTLSWNGIKNILKLNFVELATNYFSIKYLTGPTSASSTLWSFLSPRELHKKCQLLKELLFVLALWSVGFYLFLKILPELISGLKQKSRCTNFICAFITLPCSFFPWTIKNCFFVSSPCLGGPLLITFFFVWAQRFFLENLLIERLFRFTTFCLIAQFVLSKVMFLQARRWYFPMKFLILQ